MAKQVMLSDDFDGSTPATTINFAIDDDEGKLKRYSVDLNKEHANTFREFVMRFADAGREKGQPKRNPEVAKIKEWADKKGIDIPSRGRIPKEVTDQYYQENPPENKDNGEAPSAASDETSDDSEIPTLA